MARLMNVLADMGMGRFAAILLAAILFLCILFTRV